MITYPNNIKKNTKYKEKEYGNRGMTLEAELNDSNKYYLESNIAVIYKKPTPIKVVKQINEKIVKAYFEKPSTTDYNGLYKGKYVDFEAKETKNTTSFPLKNFHSHQIEPIKNIHNHQIKHMEQIIKHNGICFIIIRFTKLNKTYLLFAKDLIKFINTNKRKSIPLEYFQNNAYLIKDKLMPKVDYIDILNKYGGIQ